MKPQIQDLIKIIERKQSYIDRNQDKDTGRIQEEIRILENFYEAYQEQEFFMISDSMTKHQAIINLKNTLDAQSAQLQIMKQWILAAFQIIHEHRAFIKANEPGAGYSYIPKALQKTPFQRLLQILYKR